MVGSADTPSVALATLAALGLRVSLTLVADAPQALTASLRSLPFNAPSGALEGASADVIPPLRSVLNIVG